MIESVYGELHRNAPLYYVVGGWIAEVVHPLLVPKIIGLIFGVATLLLAGGRWRSTGDFVRAIVITGVFIHLSGGVNPMVGNKRSIVLPILLGVTHPKLQNRYARLLLIAVAGSVYPQAGLLALAYLSLRMVFNRGTIPEGSVWWKRGIEIALMTLVFLGSVFPILWDSFVVSGSSSAHNLTAPLLERWQSGGNSLWQNWRGLYLIFIAGARSAFFRIPSTVVMFCLFLAGTLVTWLVLRHSRHSFRVSDRWTDLAVTGLLLWGMAHLTHPLIHHPFKYSRITLPLAFMGLFLDNLRPLLKTLRRTLSRKVSWWYGTVPLFTFTLIGWSTSLWLLRDVWTRGPTSLHVFWPGVIAGTIVLLWGGTVVKNYSQQSLIILACLWVGFWFYPHSFQNYSQNREKYQEVYSFQPLFRTIRNLPETTVIAGPPGHMDWIPVFGRRDVYFNHKRRSIETVCERIQSFADAYFANNARDIRQYLNQHPVDYILVDRRKYRGASFRECRGNRRVIRGTNVLDRTYSGAEFSLGNDLYLLSKQQLIKALNDGSEP